MRLIFVLKDKLVFICHEKCEGEVDGFEDLSKVYQAIRKKLILAGNLIWGDEGLSVSDVKGDWKMSNNFDKSLGLLKSLLENSKSNPMLNFETNLVTKLANDQQQILD